MAESRVDILLALKSKLEGADQAIGFLGDLAKGLTVAAVAYKALEIAKKSGELASSIKNLSAEANLTTDAFQALTLGSAEFGVTQEHIVRGATTLRKNLEEAAKNGASPMNDQLRRLGLSAAGLQALAPERQFEEIGRAIATAEDKNAAFAAGIELLGAKQAPKLLEFLRTLGTEGYDKIAKSARALTLSKEELDTLDAAANRWERMAAAAKVIGARATLLGFGVMDSIGAGLANPEAKGGNPNALETQISILRGRIASYQEHGRGDDARVKEYERTLAILEIRLQEQRAQEKIAAATQEAAAAERETAMHAAELKSQLDSMDNKESRENRQRILGGDTKSLNDAIAAVRKKTDEEYAAHQKEAESYKNLASPVRAYKMELDKLVVLKRENLLTDEEAAAAAKILTQRFLEQAGEIGNHTRRLSELQEQRELIEGNPFLSAEQRKSQLATVLEQENVELDKQIALLRQRQSLSPEEAAQLRGLVKQRTANQYNPAGFSFGQTVGADLMSYANSFGTTAQQAAGVIRNTIGRAVDGVSRGIAGWLTGTRTWRQVLQEVGTGVLEEIIGAIVRIGIQQVINATIGRTLQAAAMATTMATTAATAASISAMMVAPATLATIASFGGAAIAAPEEILAALAATAPLGLFYEGGHTGPGGIVHEDEWVAPNWMVDHPVYGGMIDMLESARAGGAAAAPGSISGSGGKPQRTIVLVGDMISARTLARDPEWDSEFVKAAKRNRGQVVS